MMNTLKISQLFILSLLVISCNVTEQAQRAFKLSAVAGYGYGGMVENTDLSVVPNSRPAPEASVDAFTGATIGGPTAGIRVNKAYCFGGFETGVDYMYNHQTFTYADQGNMFTGVRKFHVNQLMIPFTYNLGLFGKSLPNTDLQLKLGVLGQYNFLRVTDAGLTSLPEYALNKYSLGATLGVSAYPFTFSNQSKLGFYLEAYRGSRIYTDYYNQKGFEMPGSAFVKIGLRYQFKQF